MGIKLHCVRNSRVDIKIIVSGFIIQITIIAVVVVVFEIITIHSVAVSIGLR